LLDSRLVYATNPPLRYASMAPVRLHTGVAGCLFAEFTMRPRNPARAIWAVESYAALIALFLHDPDSIDGPLAARLAVV
jgi:hypothetical protein